MVSLNFEKEIRSAVKSSSFFHQIFQVGYPKLLRLFHDLFSRLTVTNVSGAVTPASSSQPAVSEEASRFASDSSVLLKALSSFETAYLRESLARLLEPVNQAFPEKPIAGNRTVATRDDVEKLLRAISRELEISKFDPHLLKSVSKNATKAINMYSIRSEHCVANDSTVFTIPGGNAPVNPSQLLNIEIVNCLWTLAEGVWKIMDDFEDEQIVSVLTDSVEAVQKLIQSVVEPLVAGVTRDIELSISKIHKEDFNKSTKAAEPGLSPYVIEVGTKLRWVQREIMMRFHCGDDTKEWYKSVGTRLIDIFLRQASLIRPLNTEQGKLKLTTDMTQLEFALNQWIQPTGIKLDVAMGTSYKGLRAFRQLLFLDLNQVSAAHHTADIPKVVVAHHLIVRAHPLIQLPVAAFGWTELAYSDWLDVHSEEEAVLLLGQCLSLYMDDVRKQGGREYRVEFVAVRNLLNLSQTPPHKSDKMNPNDIIARNRRLALERVSRTAKTTTPLKSRLASASAVSSGHRQLPTPNSSASKPSSSSSSSSSSSVRNSKNGKKRGINLDYCEYNLTNMHDTRGGFIPVDSDLLVETSIQATEEEKAMVPIGSVCAECGSLDVDAVLFKHYKVFVCRRCKNTLLDKYSLLTKTEVREDYLLTESELRDTEKLPYWMKKNPHKDTYASMLLYLRMHVEEFAIKKWGSLEKLDEEFERRGVTKQARKKAKFEAKLTELRKKTLTSTWMKLQEDQEHVHEYENMGVIVRSSGRVIQQTCRTCGVLFEFEEL
ncbi:hypothetical protein HDU79_010246 [Rhizoclosmatium sp. JEL0117]|nr:hypothetical protein HDU79_010246 [Rhizoclosmatium sp. JEL0117]